MSFRNEVRLDLAGAAGEVKAVITPLSFNIYQNGIKVQKRGSFKPVFPIQTNSGTTEPIQLRVTSGRVRTAFFRDQQIPLEKKLDTLDYVLGIGLFLLIFILGCVFIGYTMGIVGGALLGGTIGLGIMLNFGFLRNEQNTLSKFIIALCISVACYLIYFGVGLVVTTVFRTILFGF